MWRRLSGPAGLTDKIDGVAFLSVEPCWRQRESSQTRGILTPRHKQARKVMNVREQICMIAARVIVEEGVPAETAIAGVRAARPGAIETDALEAWVRHTGCCGRRLVQQ